MIVEIPIIHVAKHCPKCHTMPNMIEASGWKIVKCVSCGMKGAVSRGSMNDAIGEYNHAVEVYVNDHDQ